MDDGDCSRVKRSNHKVTVCIVVSWGKTINFYANNADKHQN